MKIFMPAFTLIVKDSLCGGAIQRQIGHASIDLYQFFKINNKEEIKQEEKDDEKSYLILSQNEYYDDEKKENIGLLSGDEKTEKKHKWNIFKSDKKSEKSKKCEKLEEEDTVIKYDILKANEYGIGKHTEKYMENRDELDYELENKLVTKPFNNIDFFNGKSKKRHVGYFKGLISITNSKKNDGLNNKYLKDLMKPSELFLRLYIRNGINLQPKDANIGNIINASSDPYLIIKLGNKKISTRNKYISNSLNPSFCESFEFSLILPGISELKIEVWDYDGIGDDLIGITRIDIEDRWYSKKWRNLKYFKNNIMPLEKR
eukprot:201741_1